MMAKLREQPAIKSPVRPLCAAAAKARRMQEQRLSQTRNPVPNKTWE